MVGGLDFGFSGGVEAPEGADRDQGFEGDAEVGVVAGVISGVWMVSMVFACCSGSGICPVVAVYASRFGVSLSQAMLQQAVKTCLRTARPGNGPERVPCCML